MKFHYVILTELLTSAVAELNTVTQMYVGVLASNLLSIYLYIYMYICLSVCLSVGLYVCMSVYAIKMS